MENEEKGIVYPKLSMRFCDFTCVAKKTNICDLDSAV